jgi:hypothetical protein
VQGKKKCSIPFNPKEGKKEQKKQNEASRKQNDLEEKVRSKRINLEGNTHTQEINVSQCPV